MTKPSSEANGGQSESPDYVLITHDEQTGQETVLHLAEPPKYVVQLEDGRRLPLEEYLAKKEGAEREHS